MRTAQAPMDDLVSFLRDRMAEDEAAIRTWESACWHLEACDDTGGYLERFDEKRMLAEVEARRRVIKLYENALAAQRSGSISLRNRTQDEAAVDVLGEAVKALALPYADHDGYREEWRL